MRPAMLQAHVGGYKKSVNFKGYTINVIDPATGEAQAMKLFVAAMRASSYTYAEAMGFWRNECGMVDHKSRIITTERAKQSSTQAIVNMFAEWFAVLGFTGCSSHSGRRTFITNAARNISSVGGSLRDVQSLAGHSSLTTTQRYIEVNGDTKRRVVEM